MLVSLWYNVRMYALHRFQPFSGWFFCSLQTISIGWIVDTEKRRSSTLKKTKVYVYLYQKIILYWWRLSPQWRTDPSDEKSFKTDCPELGCMGKIWTQSITGAMERKTNGERVKLKDRGWKSLEKLRRTPAGFQENKQDRYIRLHGKWITVSLSNYEGKAIDGLDQAVNHKYILWMVAVLFSIGCIFWEQQALWYGRYFLFCLLRSLSLTGVCTLDIKGVLLSAVPALFMGYAPVAGAAYLANSGKGWQTIKWTECRLLIWYRNNGSSGL